METSTAGGSVFDLPERLRAKGDVRLIQDDERAFGRLRAALADTVADAESRLDRARRQRVTGGQEALDRDLDIQRLSRRLRILRRFGVDACVGRIDPVDGEPVRIGRFGVADADGTRLLVDWRAPAAERYFAASHGDPMGVSSRRRYRWLRGRIVDYWDEVFVDDGIDHRAALDDQSAFIASLGQSRTPKMRDVLATIQSDQDATIRAGSDGALVVDGGPGTGKTVVALHRAAYLLYADARLQGGRGGLLFIGPHRPYIDYIDDVLPSLGEEGARVATPADLVTGGQDAREENDPAVRRLKSDARIAAAVERAVRLWQHPPTRATSVPTHWGPVRLSAAQCSGVFEASDGALSHNELRIEAWDRFLDIVADRIGDLRRDSEADPISERWSQGWGEATPADETWLDAVSREGDFDAYGADDEVDAPVRMTLEADSELRARFDAFWPLLDPDALLRGLWRSGAMLRACAPWLGEADIAALTAAGARGAGWTDVDLPALDVARTLVGDPSVEVRERRRRAEAEAEREIRDAVRDDLIASDDSDMRIMGMLRGQDLRRTLAAPDERALDPFAGPFAHIVVDEAQELSDAQWQMLVRRCPSRSFTIVGDRAQARHGFPESWANRLARVGLDRVRVATLTVNYRTPAEVMDVAGPVIRAVLPDANVPGAVRSSGLPVREGAVSELTSVLDDWEAAHPDGIAVVIGAPWFDGRERVRSLSPVLVKGLEFDLVVIVDPEGWGSGVTGAVDRYVAMTRATGELVLLRS